MLTIRTITEHLLQNRLALTSYIYSVTRNFHLAEDVFQEVCVKAVSQQHNFETRDHLSMWFRVSARNRAIDVIRAREGQYVGLSEDMLGLIEKNWDQAGDPHREKLMDSLRDCLATLTPRSQRIVKLRYFENRPGREVAELMGQKVESAYQAIARIHRILGDCISQKLGTETR
ncbi:RNA polymerase sigma factor [Rubripirellula reticaptiva]|uniref:RNA polymerase sigma factor SigM n=1 Tax=Rubripirellula reticaptiva TaxID=2528013 RepID=A0A5C6FF29_9BACT|nr:sigma-70 family RNA polymerase sigma factor [Rubripirellula reticaptiva]TWU58191.1 RNA polymerase sigma factor SigM [Rubripirellula reticaptiva]